LEIGKIKKHVWAFAESLLL